MGCLTEQTEEQQTVLSVCMFAGLPSNPWIHVLGLISISIVLSLLKSLFYFNFLMLDSLCFGGKYTNWSSNQNVLGFFSSKWQFSFGIVGGASWGQWSWPIRAQWAFFLVPVLTLNLASETANAMLLSGKCKLGDTNKSNSECSFLGSDLKTRIFWWWCGSLHIKQDKVKARQKEFLLFQLSDWFILKILLLSV